MSPAYSVKGRFDTESHARLARRRYMDDPDGFIQNEAPYYRVKLIPSEDHPRTPWVLLAFEWREDADACDEMGEVR